MKITPLWKDPVGWAEQIAKTKRRVLIFSLVQLVFVGGGLGCIYWVSGDVEVLQNPRLQRLVPILVGAGPILGFGIGYPIMYLYALHRLLLIIKSEK
jgi:hypothetical protein